MSASAWDPALGRCVDALAAVPGQNITSRNYEEEPAFSGYPEADYYLNAVRQLGASAQVSQFNALVINPDYRQRFFVAYPKGRSDGLAAALAEIVTEIDSVLQAVYLATEAIADDPALIDDVIGAMGFLYIRNALCLSTDENQKMNAKLVQIQKRLSPGFAQRPEVAALPFEGMRESTRRVMQAVSSLQIWRNAISGPSKMTLSFAAVDSVFKSSQDWSDVLVGAEEEAATLFATTTEALIQMNCDPTGQGYNLGWIAGYMALWVATTVVFEAMIALESPL